MYSSKKRNSNEAIYVRDTYSLLKNFFVGNDSIYSQIYTTSEYDSKQPAGSG